MKPYAHVVAIAVALTACGEAAAQTRCEPTLAQPCKPQERNAGTAPGDGATRRDPARLNQSPIPELRLDRDTSLGVGRGGIIGLERKFEPK